MNESSIQNATINGTDIVIKQIFLTVNPEEFVRWADLINMLIMWFLFYYIIKLCLKIMKRGDQQATKVATAVIVQDEENGTARIVMGS